jgi:hypothetical protein
MSNKKENIDYETDDSELEKNEYSDTEKNDKEETKRDEVVNKRKPGRPPKKNKTKDVIPKLGILPKSDYRDAQVEFVYDSPTDFKKITGFWKSLSAEQIRIEFLNNEMNMYTSNFNETNDVQFKFFGDKMLKYYCEQPITIVVTYTNLESVFNKLDKIYNSISFIIQKNKQVKKLIIVVQTEFNMSEQFDIDLVLDNDDASLQNVKNDKFENKLSEKHMLQFKLPSKYFKKMISDTKQMDKQWTVEKYGTNGPLQFTYKSGNGQVNTRIISQKPEDLDIKCNLTGDRDIISTSVFVDNIKPIATAVLGDYVMIFISKNQPMLITTDLNKSAVIANVIIKTVDYTSA